MGYPRKQGFVHEIDVDVSDDDGSQHFTGKVRVYISYDPRYIDETDRSDIDVIEACGCLIEGPHDSPPREFDGKELPGFVIDHAEDRVEDGLCDLVRDAMDAQHCAMLGV